MSFPTMVMRQAVRVSKRHTAFTLLAAVTLAVGIALTTVAFSLIRGVLLTPPPYPEPDRLVAITSISRTGLNVSPGCHTDQWLHWQREADGFASIAAYTWNFDFLVSTNGSESVEGLDVTLEFFQTTGLRPLLGREFVRADCATTNQAPTAIILGHQLWQRRFGGDRAILGQAIKLGRMEQPLTVVGIMPPGVRFLPAPTAVAEPNYRQDAFVDYWLPVWPEGMRTDYWSVLGRLKENTTLAQAQAQLTVIAEAQAGQEPQLDGITARAQPLLSELNREGRKVLLPLLGAVTLVLVISCANVAGLLLVRGLRRRPEFAVRSALGASRWLLLKQVLLESLPVGLGGGVVGGGLAMVVLQILKSVSGEAIPRVNAVTIDWRACSFCMVLGILAAAGASLLPALRASQTVPVEVLKAAGLASGTSRAERRLLGLVAGAQIALTVALLVGAGLLLRTVDQLLAIRAGFDTTRLLTLSVTQPDPRKWVEFHTRAIEVVAQVPGVPHAAFAWGLPLTGNHWTSNFELPGHSPPAGLNSWPTVPSRAITPDYFATMGMTLVAGRTFRESERWDSSEALTNIPSVVIVNQAFVDTYLPDGPPLGRKLRFPHAPAHLPAGASEVIGVVANVRNDRLQDKPVPELYFSFWQRGPFTKHLVVRTIADPRTMIPAISQALRTVDPTVAIENIKTMDQVRDDSVAPQLFISRLLVGLALAASLLAAVGIYGVLSFSVNSRRRELAIRVAIGASRRDVLIIVLQDVLRLTAAGLVAGWLVAILLGRLLRGFLFEASAFDPFIHVAVLLVTVVLAAIAGWLPARRAIATEPMSVLRGD